MGLKGRNHAHMFMKCMSCGGACAGLSPRLSEISHSGLTCEFAQEIGKAAGNKNLTKIIGEKTLTLRKLYFCAQIGLDSVILF